MLVRRSAIALSRRATTRPITPRSFTTTVVRRELPNHYLERHQTSNHAPGEDQKPNNTPPGNLNPKMVPFEGKVFS